MVRVCCPCIVVNVWFSVSHVCFLRFLLQQGASLSAVNCDGDVPLDIALDEETESLLQDYTLKQGKEFFFYFYSRHYTQASQAKQKQHVFSNYILISLADVAKYHLDIVPFFVWPQTA